MLTINSLTFKKTLLICVLKVPFRVFDKLKNETQSSMLKFCFYLNIKNEIQIIDVTIFPFNRFLLLIFHVFIRSSFS